MDPKIRFWHGTENMIRRNLGSRSGINEDSSLLGFSSLSIGRYLPFDMGYNSDGQKLQKKPVQYA
jgi:hypothetical protein